MGVGGQGEGGEAGTACDGNSQSHCACGAGGTVPAGLKCPCGSVGGGTRARIAKNYKPKSFY